MRKGCPSLAAALVRLALLHGVAAAETASCPLSDERLPRDASSRCPRYEVQVTDGGPGDLDATVDGACELALTACLGTRGLRAAEPVQRVRVSVRGKPINATPREIAAELIDAFARLSGAERVENGVSSRGAGTAPEIVRAGTRRGFPRRRGAIRTSRCADGAERPAATTSTREAPLLLRTTARDLERRPSASPPTASWCPIEAESRAHATGRPGR